LKPVIKVARMIKSHWENVVTYFDHRITNAVSEGLNSKIQTVKKTLTGIAIGPTSRPLFSFTAGAKIYIRRKWPKTPCFPRKYDGLAIFCLFLPTANPDEPLLLWVDIGGC